MPDDVAAGPAPEAGVERRGPPAGDAPEGNRPIGLVTATAAIQL